MITQSYFCCVLHFDCNYISIGGQQPQDSLDRHCDLSLSIGRPPAKAKAYAKMSILNKSLTAAFHKSETLSQAGRLFRQLVQWSQLARKDSMSYIQILGRQEVTLWSGKSKYADTNIGIDCCSFKDCSCGGNAAL